MKNLSLSLNPLKSLIFFFLSFVLSTSLFAADYSCDGENVVNVHNATSNESASYTTGPDVDENSRYFKFKTQVDGEITIRQQNNKPVGGYWNHRLKVGTGCGTNDIYDGSGDRDDSTTFNVVTNTWYYVRVREGNNQNKLNFDISFDFTADIPTCLPLRDSKNLTAADNSYSNSPYYNDSNWNVGPSASALNRAYYFTVDSAGTVDIDLSRVDQDQAKFSVSKSSCPTTNDGLSSEQLNFSSAGSFYVYIYYISGSRTNIEHQLDVVFTPSVPPTITPETFSVSENAQNGDIVDTVQTTGNPTLITIDSGNSSGIFTIDDTGVITIADNTNLDYDTLPTSYTLQITATNAIGTATENITINVLDESAPTASDQSFNVDESAANNTLVGTIVATGSPTQFTILSGNTDGVFRIDNSGIIFVDDNTNLDAGTTPQYILEIKIESSEGSVTIDATITVDSSYPLGDDNTRDFTNVSLFGEDSMSLNGNLLLIGNQLLCQNSSDGATCTAPTVGVNNNSVNQHKVRIDTSVGSPSNNSWAKLTFQNGDKVVFARLYWSARIIDSTITDAEKNQARQIQIKGPSNATYTTLTSPISRFNWFNSGSTFDYAGSQDVTAYVQASGEGNYYVGGIQATNGSNRFASWALIVVVQNPDRDLNNVSIYDGFKALYAGSSAYPNEVTVPASGFLTPVGTEPFGASLFAYTGESEAALCDTAKIQNASGGWSDLTDGYGTTDDVFNASIYTPEDGFRSSHAGEANPNFQNVVGTDIDKYRINEKANPAKQFLSNSQTSTNIKITSCTPNADRYTLNMFAFETELHYPKLCYDYTYSQNGYVYTEENDGTEYPNIVIPRNSGSDITVTIYIKSQDNDVNFDHVSIYSDMNLSKVTYTGSFQRTNVNSFGYNDISSVETAQCLEAASTTSTLCRTNSPQGNFRAGIGRSATGYPLNNSGLMLKNDFTYFKYDIDPQSSNSLDTPLKLFADIQYSLSSGSTTPIEPVLGIPFGGDRMPLCPPSTVYQPEWGIFNIIDSQLNTSRDGTSSQRYYNNLLTQVSERQFSVDVVALDASTNPPVDPKDINTSVAIELVDIRGFHDVNISCQEPAVAFSPRTYLNFIEENRKTVLNLRTAYAKEDAAFRVWYIHDGNTSHLIENWESITDASGALTGINNLYEQIPDAPDSCWTPCDGAQIPAKTRTPACYECLRKFFGYPLCSRDNFAIRPESYHIALYDRNDSGSIELDENNAAQTNIPLAAGYTYMLDINATNHIDNNRTMGYQHGFTNSDPNSFARMQWQEPTAVTCINELDHQYDLNMGTDGARNDFRITDSDTGLYFDVGIYNYSMFDTSWTTVDQGVFPNQPPHHSTSRNFIVNTSDCISSSSNITDDTIVNSTDRFVGCDISSDHSNVFNGLTYRDINVTFKPYTFNVDAVMASNTIKSSGLTDDFNGSTQYIYMINNLDDINTGAIAPADAMAIRFVGNIAARGFAGNTLNNFSTSCYANDINLTVLNDINLSTIDDTGANILLQHRVRINDSNGTQQAWIDITGDSNISRNYFYNDQNGSINLEYYLNYERDNDIIDAVSATEVMYPLNPSIHTFNDFNINCTTGINCQINADQVLKDYNGSKTLQSTQMNFFYGRTFAPTRTYNTNVGQLEIFYESYCKDYDSNATLKALLQDVPTLTPGTNIGWYINEDHNISEYGNVTQSNPDTTTATDRIGEDGASNVNETTFNESAYLKGRQPATIQYNESSGYPYSTTMTYVPDSWLVFDKYNPTTNNNWFSVTFNNGIGQWTGQGVDYAGKTDSNASGTTSKRIQW